MNLAPGFTAPAGFDYTLAATSGLIDKGVPLPGINNGYRGAAPDLGAYESLQQPSLSIQDVSVVEGDGTP